MMGSTYAGTVQLLQLCAVTWVSSLMVWAAPLEDLQVEHRGGTDDLGDAGVLLIDDGPLGGVVDPEGGSFMSTGEDGSYRFGLQSEEQWRMESRNADGIVEGRYVYKTPEGQTVDISYNAGPQGYIAEGDAIPGGRAPLIDAPITDDENLILEPIKPEETVDIEPPYGALRVSSLPGYSVYQHNTIEDLENQAIIIPLPDVWPPQLTFNPVIVQAARGDLKDINDKIYGPAVFNGEELQSGVVIA